MNSITVMSFPMRKNRVRLLFLLLSLMAVTAVEAQDAAANGRYSKTRSYQIGAGAAHVLDTYLTQEKFKGTGFSLLSIEERQQTGARWSSVVEHQLHFSNTADRAGNDAMIEATYNCLFGRFYAWSLLGGSLSLQAGGMANLGLGAFYNTRNNANNPAQGRLSLNIMPSAIAAYHFPFLKRRWAVRYELQLPLVGVMFSPNYGQSYYEMFSRGNYDHNIVPTTFVAAPCMRQQVRLECSVWRSMTLSLGYLGDYQQAKVNNLKQHLFCHNIMVGFVQRFQITRQRP